AAWMLIGYASYSRYDMDSLPSTAEPSPVSSVFSSDVQCKQSSGPQPGEDVSRRPVPSKDAPPKRPSQPQLRIPSTDARPRRPRDPQAGKDSPVRKTPPTDARA